LKTEPEEWSWDDQLRAGIGYWDGVRNYEANANLQRMRLGDEAFFYHTGKEKRIVGRVNVAREFYPDPKDASGRFGLIEVKTLAPLARPVSLERVKQEPALAELALVKRPRLSVMPIDEQAWEIILALAEEKP
jgi:predicted RNA-binding protein with PUA-like domain